LKPVGFPFRSPRLRPSPSRWFRKAYYGSCDSRAFVRRTFPARSPRQAWWVTLRVSVLRDHHPPWETETRVLHRGHHPARSRPKAQKYIQCGEYLNGPSGHRSSSHPQRAWASLRQIVGLSIRAVAHFFKTVALLAIF
jgi:hypothetical protein